MPSQRVFTNNVEACDSVGAQSWAYRANEDYHTANYLLRNIDQMLAMGCNFLLNTGATLDCEFVNLPSGFWKKVTGKVLHVRDIPSAAAPGSGVVIERISLERRQPIDGARAFWYITHYIL